MAKTTKQTAIFGVEDWKKIFQSYSEADFQSYDYETLKKSFIDYIRVNYPESFNDYVESSEFIALLDVVAFMGQALAFRSDLNARENFIETAERRDSVVKLANLISYTPKRNECASGLLKVLSVSTTESVRDINGNSLSNVTIEWDDLTNPDWYEQFVAIMNSMLVDAQRVGRPSASGPVLGIKTEEYTLNVVSGVLPVYDFRSIVDAVQMQFETVSATTIGGIISEPAPRIDGNFNILLRDDRLGFSSRNNGFFFFFKQGNLESTDVFISERIENRVVDIDIDSINNSDVWVYELNQNGSLGEQWSYRPGFIGNMQENSVQNRKFFDIVSRTNDRISLIFGDGVFSEIPTGRLRVFVRSSNGQRYTISPIDMTNIQISIPYVSRIGRIETALFTLGLTSSVSNARARETISDIKARAPMRYYTSDRMVNGEDYTNFPYTYYNSIIKSKAVNRSSAGVSRFNDITDITGKYNSTSVFGNDGILYKDNGFGSFTFIWRDLIEVANIITNQIEPILISRPVQQFFYDISEPVDISAGDSRWVSVSFAYNESSGYFVNFSNDPQSIGEFSTDYRKFLKQNSLVEFVPPIGFFYDENNNLVQGEFNGKTIWCALRQVKGDGSNNNLGALPDGTGPVVLNNFVPSGSIPVGVFPTLPSFIPVRIKQAMTEQISLYRNFGIGYNDSLGWYVITSSNLSDSNVFSGQFAGDTSGQHKDASWLIKFTTDGTLYTGLYRVQRYYFSSEKDTRFSFDGGAPVFDPKIGKTINDYVELTDVTNNFSTENKTTVFVDIVDQSVESDGFVNDFQVEVSYSDIDLDGIIDDPVFFRRVVSPNTYVFFEMQQDLAGVLRNRPVKSGTVIYSFSTKEQIELVKYEYNVGQVFYATSERSFYKIVTGNSNFRELEQISGYIAKEGVSDIKFHYRHNSPLSRRIDPVVTNIVDLYVVTDSYYDKYKEYISDSTGTVREPEMPTIDELNIQYSGLIKHKMLSDSVIINSVKFKPLFGKKADPKLQATIKVVKFRGSTVTDSEIKSKIVTAVNNYFSINKWDFGETFYFSSLSSYLHEIVGDLVSSIVIVPNDPEKNFGNLYEIRCAPNEIFVSALSVSDIEVIDSLTPSAIRISQT